jgi:hypothetical protein
VLCSLLTTTNYDSTGHNGILKEGERNKLFGLKIGMGKVRKEEQNRREGR